MFAAFPFPRLPHHKPGTECPGHIVPEEHNGSVTVLRCNECGDVVGQVESWPLHDLASLALTGGMDTFIPDPEHINALPEPVRRYIHDLATRVDPAGDTAQIALLKENNAALWKRVQELEGQIAQPRLNAADLATELQRIYDSEINLHIDWLWDGGIRVALGDEMNGFVAEESVDSVAALVPWLQAVIARFYPDSTYTASLSQEIKESAQTRFFQPPQIGARVECPHCGTPHVSRMDEVYAFVCAHCGNSITVNPPKIQ